MEIAVTTQDDLLTCVALRGRITQRDVSPFDDALEGALGGEAYKRSVLLDMQDVESLDSSGVSWLLSCNKRFRQNGGRLVLHSVSPIAANVLRVLNLQQVFQIAADENAARGMLAREGSDKKEQG